MHYYDIMPVLRSAKKLGAATYHNESKLAVGQIVRIKYGSRKTAGVIVAEALKPKFNTKAIEGVVSEHTLPPDLIQTAHAMAKFYPYDESSLYSLLIPNGAHKSRRGEPAIIHPDRQAAQPELTKAQQDTLTSLRSKSSITSWLLHGVTGSGKTRIYFERAFDVLKQGRDVILLVPEIALSQQLLERAKEFFNCPIYLIHSGMTESENHKIWQSILEQTESCVVIGPRSAIFSPVKNLGLILVDEAHDQSYKQDQNPNYYALHVAAMRTKAASAQLIMGSATPNVTEFWFTKMDRISYIELSNTIHEQVGHERVIVDSRQKDSFTRNKILSNKLLDAIHESLMQRKQTLLYVNRRGHAPIVMCSDCTWRATCHRCTLPLVFHSSDNSLRCHVCNTKYEIHNTCPECSSPAIRYLGTGTQRLEAEVSKLFPHANVARLDRDIDDKITTPKLLDEMHSGQVDILIGTQMITKGFDFKHLSTVGIVNADSMLYLPDFRSAERSFQVIYQAIGRNDRIGEGGTTIIQTSSPEHHAIRTAVNHDYTSFYEAEIKDRQLASFPPFSYLLRITARRKNSVTAENALNTICKHLPSNITQLGPAPALHAIQGDNYVWHVILSAKKRESLLEFARSIDTKNVSIDMDPLDLL